MKKSSFWVVSLLLIGGFVYGGEPPIEDLQFPTLPIFDTPRPTAVSKLPNDKWYVFTSETERVVTSSPLGILKVTKYTGPTVILGKFVDGKTDEYEEKTFKSKFVYVVRGIKDGSAELLVMPLTMKSELDIVRKSLIVELIPKPNPEPKPEPKPDPNPKPIPPPPVNKPLYIAVVRDPVVVSPKQALLLGNTAFWDSLKADGSDWDFWTNKSPTAIQKNYVKLCESVQTGTGFTASIVILEKDTGKKVAVKALPETKEEVSSLINSIRGK